MGSNVNELSFFTLVYRYLFFSWLFRRIDIGSDLERAAAIRHNREQARWLPTYMLRWMWVSLVLYALAGFLDLVLEATGLSMLLYAASAMCLSFTVTIGVAWFGLKGVRGLQ